MAATAALGRKIVSISSKRQITIPQKFFHALRFDSEAECILKNGELVLRPSRPAPAEDFSEEILAELVAQGVSGEKLLAAFREKRAQYLETIGNCEVINIPGSHFIYNQKPEEVAAVIANFVDKNN